MNYRWTKQEILETRMYWIEQDHQQNVRYIRRQKLFDVVYYLSLITVVSGFMIYFAV